MSVGQSEVQSLLQCAPTPSIQSYQNLSAVLFHAPAIFPLVAHLSTDTGTKNKAAAMLANAGFGSSLASAINFHGLAFLLSHSIFIGRRSRKSNVHETQTRHSRQDFIDQLPLYHSLPMASRARAAAMRTLTSESLQASRSSGTAPSASLPMAPRA